MSDEGMKENPRTYPELLGAIERAITPKIVDLCKITTLPDAIHQALHYHTRALELIAEFVGYRHVELLERHAKEQRPKANEQRDKKAEIWRARLTARIKDLEKELRDLRKERDR